MEREYIAFLGQRQPPFDGVEDYCIQLEQALAKQGYTLKRVRMPWKEIGWMRSLLWLWTESAQWGDKWVIVQYTAFSWSQRAIPIAFLVVLLILRQRDTRLAVVFHDPQPYAGKRLVDRVRQTYQRWLMQTAYHCCENSIFTIPIDRVSWLPPNPIKAVQIPVGSNVPEPDLSLKVKQKVYVKKTVAVFGVIDVSISPSEAMDIAYAVKKSAQQVSPLHLAVMGRGAIEAKALLQQELIGADVELSILGYLPAEDICQKLVESDVLLFVRGHISSGRTSAIAGIACGLPIVAYTGSHTGHPVTEAGVLLVPQKDKEALADALTRVLKDDNLWQDLYQRSLDAQQKYFSWDAIANRFLKVLTDG